MEGLGLYDRVLDYDRVGELPHERPAAYVDVAGDAALRQAVHTRATGLVASVQVGGTHWEDVGGGGHLPGPQPSLFFAPDQIVKRRHDWGPGAVESRFADAWRSFLPVVQGWITVVEGHGADEVARIYDEVLGGRADPQPRLRPLPRRVKAPATARELRPVVDPSGASRGT